MTKGAYISPAITDVNVRQTLQSILDELEGGSITIGNGAPSIAGRAGRLWLNAATNDLYIYADGEWKLQGIDKLYHAVRIYWVDPQGITDGTSAGQTAPPAPLVTVTWSNLSNSNSSSGLALPTYGRTGQSSSSWVASPPGNFNTVSTTIWWSDVIFIRNGTEASTTATGTTPVQHTYISGTVTFTGANGITKDGSGNTVIDGGKIDTDSIKADSIDLTGSSGTLLADSDFQTWITNNTVGGNSNSVGSSAPSSPAVYDTWWDSSVNKLKYWNGSSWAAFSLEADSIVSSFTYTGTLLAQNIGGTTIGAGHIDAESIDVGTLKTGNFLDNQLFGMDAQTGVLSAQQNRPAYLYNVGTIQVTIPSTASSSNLSGMAGSICKVVYTCYISAITYISGYQNGYVTITNTGTSNITGGNSVNIMSVYTQNNNPTSYGNGFYIHRVFTCSPGTLIIGGPTLSNMSSGTLNVASHSLLAFYNSN
jgi:hypothetical protein